MTTDHESIDRDDRAFDHHVARRLRSAAEGMQLPTTTAIQAAVDGRRRQRRTRLVASTGAVAVIAAAVGVVLTLQPLGAADVVEPPPSAPDGDPLKDSDLSDVSAAQEAEISDRVVTADEYLAAFHRYRECVSAAGFELSYQELDHLEHTPDVPPVTYVVPPEAVEDGADRECYEAEFKYVDILWQTAGDDQDSTDSRQAFRACLQERGIEPADTDNEIQDQLREAGIGPAACLVEQTADADDLGSADGAIELDCSTVIDSSRTVQEGYENILGAIALPTSASAAESRHARHESVDTALPWFAKIGLFVRADAAATITVDDPETAAIRWGNGAREFFSPTLTTDGCPGDGWLVFPGGIRVDEPHCVTLSVTTPRNARTIDVGVGAPCPGQEPPPGQATPTADPQPTTAS